MAVFSTTNTTFLADLVNPQVLANVINNKLVDAMKFAPLCRIDNTLQGRPGDTITLPSFAYIGDAVNVDEGDEIPLSKLTATTVEVPVSKAGKAVPITDESVISGYGDPVGEVGRQIRLAIASKLDNDILGILDADIGTSMTEDYPTSAAGVSKGLIKFGEDIDGPKVLLINPELYNILGNDPLWFAGSDIGANKIISGVVGEIYGCQVVVTNKLVDQAYIVKPGALALYLKRDLLLETDRDILREITVFKASKIYAGYLYDPTLAIKLEG